VNGIAVAAADRNFPPDNDDHLKANGTGKSFHNSNTCVNLPLVLSDKEHVVCGRRRVASPISRIRWSQADSGCGASAS
jgi:hypothetical protein